MNFKRKKSHNGDKRIIKKFLLFPLSINDETKWFKTVEIEQVYIEETNFLESTYGTWVNHKFIKDKKENKDDKRHYTKNDRRDNK